MIWPEHQSSALKVIDVLYHFTSVDIPDLLDFFPAQYPSGFQG
jgi:hypothetical protein